MVCESVWDCRMCVAVCDGGSFCIFKRAGLKEGVTDEGLRALASAGCGEKLTSLALWSECCCVPVCGLMVCGRAGCVFLFVTGALSPRLSSCLLLLPTRRSVKGSNGRRAACTGLCRVRREADVAVSFG